MFGIDVQWLYCLIVLPLLAFGLAARHFLQKKRNAPSLPLPSLLLIGKSKGSRKIRLLPLPRILQLFAVICFALALTNPTTPSKADPYLPDRLPPPPSTPFPHKGQAIYLLIDRSSSMGEEMGYIGADNTYTSHSRLAVVKDLLKEFITTRSNDMIGLVAFARVPQVIAPLTLEHDVLIEELERLEPAATSDDDGTAMGYAVYKTLHLIEGTKHHASLAPPNLRPAYELMRPLLILATDGLEYPNPLDDGHEKRGISISEAAQLAQHLNTPLYIVNIEARLQHPDYRQNLQALKQAAQETGGGFYIAESPAALDQVYKEINSLEPMPLPVGSLTKTTLSFDKKDDEHSPTAKKLLFAIFVAIGMVLLGTSIFIETEVIRHVP
ncbi:VWA domain-containing protein [Simkania negevensis]|uniref:VWA domain-containing protein n=1 Tax=Simkania negevensis TaxID=83561 RepID=A0ABS3AVI2_9BACT|nr:VWA domain-containing protein [Simkania negevensis]